MPIFVREVDSGSHTKVTICEIAARFVPNHRHSKKPRFMVTFQPFSQATVTSSTVELWNPILVFIAILAIKVKMISSFKKC